MTDWLSLAIAIIGILLAVVFYIRGKREKSPCYSISNQSIIREYISSIKNLEITYSGQKIKNLTISKIVFWNAGKEVINWSDNIEAAPLSIHVKNGHVILGKEVIVSNELTNKFSLVETLSNDTLNIKFDYISKNNGFLAIIYHTGKSSKDIEICGKIKGVDRLKHVSVDTLRKFVVYPINLVFGLLILPFWGGSFCILSRYLAQSRIPVMK